MIVTCHHKMELHILNSQGMLLLPLSSKAVCRRYVVVGNGYCTCTEHGADLLQGDPVEAMSWLGCHLDHCPWHDCPRFARMSHMRLPTPAWQPHNAACAKRIAVQKELHCKGTVQVGNGLALLSVPMQSISYP